MRAGILDERADDAAGSSSTPSLDDPTLTERQKQVLVEIYRSFQAEDDREDAAG